MALSIRLTFPLLFFSSFLVAETESPPAVAAETWIEETYADFADGRLDAAGQNLYVAIDGTVRTIHRFDLNDDGHIDLLFNNSHDYYYHIPATQATVAADGRVSHTFLPVEGSLCAAVGDLNRDGRRDIVFCPNKDEIHPRRLLTIIYGGDEGWTRHRTGGFLTAFGADRVAIADVNADGWPDIAVLNSTAWAPGQPEGRIVRVYLGAEGGFLESRQIEFGVNGAVDMAAARLDADDAEDLVVLAEDGRVFLLLSRCFDGESVPLTVKEVLVPSEKAHCIAAADADGDGPVDLVIGTDNGIFILLGDGEGAFGPAIHVPDVRATHVSAGDLDADGRTDLVLTYATSATAVGGQLLGSGELSANYLRVLWGTRGGFSADTGVKIPIAHPRCTALGDMDGDGRPDIAVAIRHGEEVFAADSVVLLGREGRTFEPAQGDLPTKGAEHVVIAPEEANLPPRAVFSNRVGGTLGEIVSPVIYWGKTEGFSPENSMRIPKVSAYEASAADLNRDGRVDLIMPLFGHSRATSDANPFVGGTIYWGGEDGFDFANRHTVLRDGFLITSNVADFNRDGYLDLVFGQSKPDETTGVEMLILHYGGEKGFSKNGRVAIPSPGRSVSSVVADFNQDGWLDIAVNGRMADKIRIFWGGPEGFSEERQKTLDIYNPVDLETADLNGDGHLDLIVSTLEGRVLHLDRMGTMILWGSDEGFSTDNVQRVPSFMALGYCVADLDGDGHLDLVTPNYTGGNTRQTNPSHIYWGGEDGFAPTRRTELFCQSAAGALAADFNQDGKLDLAVVTHRDGGSHRSRSQVFYNDGNRFRNPEITELPTEGPHWFWHNDLGHIYDRTYRQWYESSVHELKHPATTGTLRVEADVPQGARLRPLRRAAANKEELEPAEWREIREERFSIQPTDRFVQYRAEFHSDNGDRYPVLKRVQVDFARD